MLTAYFGGEARAADRGRMVIYKAMCDLLWTLWGLIKFANSNPADDFRAYADNRFARCRARWTPPPLRSDLICGRESHELPPCPDGGEGC